MAAAFTGRNPNAAEIEPINSPPGVRRKWFPQITSVSYLK